MIRQLGQQMNIRQRALGTAEVYLTRFFLHASYFEVNTYMMVATCIYLACKTEECPQHIRTITNEARDLWPDYVSPDPTKIAECEFYLIEELDSYLIVYHPYRSLTQIIEHMSQTNNLLTFMKDQTQYAWSMINDSYATDMMLLYPPHIIATATLYVTLVRSHTLQVSQASTVVNKRFKLFEEYLGQCGIDLEKVVEATQELISLYVRWESCDEASCKIILANQISGTS